MRVDGVKIKKIFIDGQQGTTGLRIRKLLEAVPGIELLELPKTLRKSVEQKRLVVAEADAVVLCLPDESARETVGLIDGLQGRRPKILDASTAHRVADDWVFGLPELSPEQELAIGSAAKVSNPGCYPTGAILLLKPLIAAKILPDDYPVCVHGVSGYSGGGAKMIERFESGEMTKFEIYGLGLDHKHIPELQKYTGLRQRPIFIPSVAAFREGMIDIIPIHLRLLPDGVTKSDIIRRLDESYRDSRFVKVIQNAGDDRLLPDVLNGTNLIELRVHGSESFNQIVLSARFDNLGKGASGAAVQNLGLMLGLDVSNVLKEKLQ